MSNSKQRISGTGYKGEHGVVMLLVLWVLVLLSVIVGEFCYAMRTEVNITRNLKEKAIVYYVALAGFNAAISEIAFGEGPITKYLLEAADEDIEKARWRVNNEIPAIPYRNGSYKLWIDNESGRFDLNSVEQPILMGIFSGFDIEAEEANIIVDSILDWRDSNSLHRLNGAEDDYYRSLPTPYDCRDADFESVEELKLIRGVTPGLYDGRLRAIFTVLERPDTKTIVIERRRETADVNKINLNAASQAVLTVLPGMTEQMAADIIQYRKEKDIWALSDIVEIMGARNYAKAAPYFNLKNTNYYTIHSIGHLEDSQAEHYLKVLVVLDPTAARRYRILKWWDHATF